MLLAPKENGSILIEVGIFITLIIIIYIMMEVKKINAKAPLQ